MTDQRGSDASAGAHPPPAPAGQDARPSWSSRYLFGPLQVAAIAIPLVIALAASLWIWHQVERDVRDLAARNAELLVQYLARAFEVQDSAIASIQARVEGMDWDAIGRSPELLTLLDRLDDATPFTHHIGILDPQGVMVVMSNRANPHPRTHHADREFFAVLSRATSNTAHVSPPIVGRFDSRTVIVYARPHLGAEGTPSGGVIWTSFLPSGLAALFRGLSPSADDVVMLLRTDGAVLARHPEIRFTAGERLAPATPPMRAQAGAPPDSGTPANGGWTRTGFATGPSPFDGIERLYAARRIDAMNLAVLYGRSERVMRWEWLQRSLAVLGIAALSSLVLLLLTRHSQRAVRSRIEAERRARQEAEFRAQAERARADAEALLRQNQRVEMLGQIAAGIVHDVRNTVQTVHAGAALIDRAAAQGNLARVREVADMLRQAASRGVQLAQRLLAFRKESAEDATCDPSETVASTCVLLNSALGPAWRLQRTEAAGLPARVRGSQAELDSALMNLVINARDAMPQGGDIQVSLRPAAAAPRAAAPAVASGNPAMPNPAGFLELVVTDTGTGMDADTLSRATDAFFTTKPASGTGLGLSSIRAFVEAVGGAMHLQSTPGQGTTVTLWLPAADSSA